MVDRVTTYLGQLARVEDILSSQQYGMVGLAKLASGVLGSTTIVNAFTVTPTGPASLNVILTSGEVYQLENLEASTWSSLATDTHTILKQGILLDPLTFGITPPGTVGFSQVFLVEVQYQDLDTGSLVLPYYNAANPALPFSGPGNAGTAQNTVRKGAVAAQVKAGIAAATGTQVAPTADAGWTGVYTVTVANGATTITSGNISQVAAAPFIPCTLPNVPVTDQSGIWRYGVDTGTANNYVVTLNPIPASYGTGGMVINVKIAHANTGASVINCNGLGNKSITYEDGTAIQSGDLQVGAIVALKFDGTNFQIGMTKASVLNIKRTQVVADRGTSTQVVPDSTSTRVTAYSIVNVESLGGTTFSSGLITVGAGDAGLWFVSLHCRQLITVISGFTNAIHINGSATPLFTDGANVPTGGATAHGAGGRLINLNAGDTIEMRLLQTTGGSVTFNDLYDMTALRLGAA